LRNRNPKLRSLVRPSSVKRLRLAILSSPKNVPLFARNSIPNPPESARHSPRSRALRPSLKHHFDQPAADALRFLLAAPPLSVGRPVGGKLYPETVLN